MRVNIYIIDSQKNIGDIIRRLKPYGNVILLDKNEKEILNYPEIFENNSPKIIGLNPGITEWKFPIKALKRLKNLRGISTKSAWACYLDLDYCQKYKIAVTNCPGANSQSVAEYAIWMMLSLARKLPLQIKDTFKVHLDDNHEQFEITGKRIGVVGLGNVGGRIAKLGQGLGMIVTYWSRHKKEVSFKYVELNDLLSQSDFVFNSLETCEETKGLLNKNNLKFMKKTAYFISVIGGLGWGIQDDDYLIKAVNDKKLAGFSIENEDKPGSNYPHQFNSNIFIPANYAWFTKEAKERVKNSWVEGIIGIVKNKKINRVV